MPVPAIKFESQCQYNYLINRKWQWGIISFLLIWIILILAAPFLQISTQPVFKNISRYLYLLFRPTCHQISSRSFHLGGFAFAVCIRCFAFYVAGLVVCLYYLFQRVIYLLPTRIYFILCCPLLLDFILEKIGIYHNLPILRFTTGFLSGLALFQFLLVAVSDKSKSIKNELR